MKFFAPINVAAQSAPGLVARRIHEAIATGELRPGDRLPAESELASQFGIAIMTVRAALAALRDIGLLVTVRGRHGGNFVAEDVGERFAEASKNASVTLTEWRDLTDWRRAISGEACYLATERANDTNLRTIRDSGVEFDRALNKYPDRRFADTKFHCLIAEVSASPRLLREETEIQVALTETFMPVVTPHGSKHLATYTHQPIIKAISLRNPEAARSAMIEHAEDTYKWVSLLF